MVSLKVAVAVVVVVAGLYALGFDPLSAIGGWIDAQIQNAIADLAPW